MTGMAVFLQGAEMVQRELGASTGLNASSSYVKDVTNHLLRAASDLRCVIVFSKTVLVTPAAVTQDVLY